MKRDDTVKKGMLAFIRVWGMSPKKLLLKEGEWKGMTGFLSCAKRLASIGWKFSRRRQAEKALVKAFLIETSWA